jgi:hypothetical protein
MCDEYLINLWMEFRTDSVERRLEIVDKVKEFFRKPTKSDFRINGDDGMELFFFNHYYMEPESVKELMDKFKDAGDVLAYEYNVDEVEYNNIKHLYEGD